MAQTAEAEVAQRTLVVYEVKDGVAYLTLDDPPANTYTHEMMRQLDLAFSRPASTRTSTSSSSPARGRSSSAPGPTSTC